MRFTKKIGPEILVVVAIFAVVLVGGNGGEPLAPVHAQSPAVPVTGYAWSDNIGWIDFNCENTSSCGSNQWGVQYNQDQTLTGYAWSDNIGWIQFGGFPGFPPGFGGVGTTAVNAEIQGAQLMGWVRAVGGVAPGENDGFTYNICLPGNPCPATYSPTLGAGSDGWDGWVALSGNGWGVTYDSSTGSLDGFAWGDDVIGWVDFVNVVITPDTAIVNITANPLVVAPDNNGDYYTDLTYSAPSSSSFTSCTATTIDNQGNPVTIPIWNGGVTTPVPGGAGITVSGVTVPTDPTRYEIACETAGGVLANDFVVVNHQGSTPVGIQITATPLVVNGPSDVVELQYWTPNGTNFTSCEAATIDINNSIISSVTNWNGGVSVPNANGTATSVFNVNVPQNPTTYEIGCYDTAQPINSPWTAVDTVTITHAPTSPSLAPLSYACESLASVEMVVFAQNVSSCSLYKSSDSGYSLSLPVANNQLYGRISGLPVNDTYSVRCSDIDGNTISDDVYVSPNACTTSVNPGTPLGNPIFQEI